MTVAQRNEAPGDLELVRRFVNTRDVEEGTDELDGPESLLGWFSDTGLLDDEEIADEEDLKRALALREGIRSLLLANSGKELEPADLRQLNRVAGSVCLRVRFDEEGGPTLGSESSGVSAALGRSWRPWCGPQTRGYGAG
jgi:predicted RNA-binding Zn ribbon-like protein